MIASYVVLNIPHSSTVIPAHVRESLQRLSEDDLTHEILLMTDHYTDELFDYQFDAVRRIMFPVSRLVLDPERFVDDTIEPMAEKGMGLVYMKTSDGRPLRQPGFIPTKTELIEEFYRPHHKELNTIVAESLRAYHSCLILDCHSFPLKPLPYESHSENPRPEICLGTDPFHTPEWLAGEAERVFQAEGFQVALNYPFTGTMMPNVFYKQDRSVHSLMIEVRRSLYMNELSGERLPGFSDFKMVLLTALRNLILVTRQRLGLGLS